MAKILLMMAAMLLWANIGSAQTCDMMHLLKGGYDAKTLSKYEMDSILRGESTTDVVLQSRVYCQSGMHSRVYKSIFRGACAKQSRR